VHQFRLLLGFRKQYLLPPLPTASVIVMDNVSFHQRLDIQESICQAGLTLLFLPPYLPYYLNPIEHKWTPAKAIRKQKPGWVSQLVSCYQIQSFYTRFAIFHEVVNGFKFSILG
jgi:hypothetical protein